jgi:hypothetical protein
MLVNGGFETGSLLPWLRTPLPSENCGGAAGGQVGTLSPHSGTYDLQDQYKGQTDKISQQFPVIAGQMYIVSF